MSDIVLETKVHRLERPWVNALYAEFGCVAAIHARLLTSSTQVHTFFLTYSSAKDLEPMAAPRQHFPAQIETLVPANSCLAFSACSGLVTKNVFDGLGWYPKLGPAEHRASHHTRKSAHDPAPDASSAYHTS